MYLSYEHDNWTWSGSLFEARATSSPATRMIKLGTFGVNGRLVASPRPSNIPIPRIAEVWRVGFVQNLTCRTVRVSYYTFDERGVASVRSPEVGIVRGAWLDSPASNIPFSDLMPGLIPRNMGESVPVGADALRADRLVRNLDPDNNPTGAGSWHEFTIGPSGHDDMQVPLDLLHSDAPQLPVRVVHPSSRGIVSPQSNFAAQIVVELEFRLFVVGFRAGSPGLRGATRDSYRTLSVLWASQPYSIGCTLRIESSLDGRIRQSELISASSLAYRPTSVTTPRILAAPTVTSLVVGGPVANDRLTTVVAAYTEQRGLARRLANETSPLYLGDDAPQPTNDNRLLQIGLERRPRISTDPAAIPNQLSLLDEDASGSSGTGIASDRNRLVVIATARDGFTVVCPDPSNEQVIRARDPVGRRTPRILSRFEYPIVIERGVAPGPSGTTGSDGATNPGTSVENSRLLKSVPIWMPTLDVAQAAELQASPGALNQLGEFNIDDAALSIGRAREINRRFAATVNGQVRLRLLRRLRSPNRFHGLDPLNLD